MENEIIELRKKVKRLTALLEASVELKHDIELNSVLEKVLDVMCKVVQVEAGTLWLWDQEKNLLCAEVANGPMAHKILNIKLDMREGIANRVMKTRQSEFVADVSKDPQWAKRVDAECGFVTKSLLTVPLITQNGVLGALQLVNKKDGCLTCEDVKMAEALAVQAALAIQNSQLYDNVQRFSMSTIRSLTLALDACDPYTAGHSARVSTYTVWIAKELKLDPAYCRELERAALMHDIGKMALPDYILSNAELLSEAEFDIVKLHPQNGAKILSGMEPTYQKKLAQEVAKYHHERFDGAGYPEGLAGQDIPLAARIVATADAFDAMTTDRPYCKARTCREALKELMLCQGTQFDPQIVGAFAQVLEKKNYLEEDISCKKALNQIIS